MPMTDHDAPHRFPGPGTLDRALALVRFLRAECPWDRAQTAASLVPHLLEEAHEVADAIHEGRTEDLAEELGDLLLNLAFQVVVAEEGGTLDAHAVYGALETKMVARHPHLFGTGPREDWETLKARERAAKEGSAGPTRGVLSGVARGLDPLTKAYRIQERVAAVGFDWPDYHGALDKVREELEESRVALEGGAPEEVEEELGDLLFAVVNLARLAGTHPTTALARANGKFTGRFERLEQMAGERGIRLEEAGLEALDRLWDELKAEG
jgi:nucleoside triphosphate diphosphatase